MTTQPILSVILPIYNVEAYLRQCLESVYNQTVHGGMEVICVNDGSTDGSRDIIQEFKDRYTDLIIVDRKNGGLSAARNSGIKIANGKYIYFLDSDDYLLENTLKNALENLLFFNTDISCFNSLVREDLLYFKNIKNIEEILSGKDYYELNYKINRFFPPSAVWMYIYKKDFLLKNNLLFKEGTLHEDEQFSPRAFYLAKRVKLFNFPILYHRTARKGAITYIIKEKNIKDSISNAKDLVFFFNKQKAKKIFYLKIFEIYLSISKHIINNSNFRKNYFFDKNNYSFMKICAISWEWYTYYWLFRYSTPLFRWYGDPNKSILLKKILNRIFRIFYFINNYFSKQF